MQRNVAQLRADGVVLIDPEEGYLSCGMRGPGRMAEPDDDLRAPSRRGWKRMRE